LENPRKGRDSERFGLSLNYQLSSLNRVAPFSFVILPEAKNAHEIRHAPARDSVPLMSSQPPLLPEETLSRVLRLARFDGMGALILGGMFALFAAAARDFPFAAIGLLGSGAGAVELHGAALLRQGEPRGMRWLVASQPFLLTVILCYCALRLWFVEIPPIPESMQNLFAMSARQWGMSVEEYQRALNQITALAVACVATGFQGGMMIYYLRRRAPVYRALDASGEA
jgi:hypothetical protein